MKPAWIARFEGEVVGVLAAQRGPRGGAGRVLAPRHWPEAFQVSGRIRAALGLITPEEGLMGLASWPWPALSQSASLASLQTWAMLTRVGGHPYERSWELPGGPTS